MIELLFEIIEEAIVNSEAYIELRKLANNPFLRTVYKVYRTSQKLQNPQAYFQKYLSTLTPIQIQNFNKILTKYVRHANFQKLYIHKLNTLKNKPQNLTENFFQNVKEKYSNLQLNSLKDIRVIMPLTSSWLSHGIFIPLYKSGQNIYGTLELTLKSGKNYLYLNVSYDTWENMLSDKTFVHKTGLGKSGSAFWRGYLDNYIETGNRARTRIKSQLRIIRRKTTGFNPNFFKNSGYANQKTQRTKTAK